MITLHLTREQLDTLGPAGTLDALSANKIVVWGSLSRSQSLEITSESKATAHFPDAASAEQSARLGQKDLEGQWVGDGRVTLDLRGEVCPFTFVRTKLTLEEMRPGDRLRVIVDHEPASRNIPRSAREWGQTIVHVGPIGAGVWQILIERTDA